MSDGTPVPGELAIGDHLAGYRLDEIIARGGMAVVYRAFDERLGRSVALKVLAAPLARDEAFRRRFIRESRVAAAVDHPNIVPIFEAGEAGGVLFIAMRLVPARICPPRPTQCWLRPWPRRPAIVTRPAWSSRRRCGAPAGSAESRSRPCRRAPLRRGYPSRCLRP